MINKDSNINKIVGKKIKLERIKRDLSQEQLADLSNISKNFVGAIERGESSPTIETLAKIANAFEISLPELIDVSKVEI
ncbi:helix-turn-helix transcriptional regulator [bacterium]|nr:helix-turn-helix transcriptional regulator [bacterium]